MKVYFDIAAFAVLLATSHPMPAQTPAPAPVQVASIDLAVVN